METFRNGELVFDLLERGPGEGEPVVLLHGFPQGMHAWDEVAERLAGQGLRTWAPDQRGYSADARPPRRRDYRTGVLVSDVLALLDAAGLRRAHVVGHDWGAAVAWALAARWPDRVSSLTALSVPHPGAFLRAMRTSAQPLRSWYMAAFQLPILPELLLSAGDGAASRVRTILARTGLPPELSERYVDRITERPALTAMLHWYRALPLSNLTGSTARVPVPTLYVWSTGDHFLDRRGAEDTARFCTGDFRFEEILGASHWLPETRPELMADLVAEHVRKHSAAG
jgi:pimeloyl-ACP methyl ester carboxylesterase